LDLLVRFPNLIVTRTFSKVYGLAALRIGYSVSNPQVAEILNRVRQPFNTNTLAQAAAVAALDDREHVGASVRMNTAGLEQLGTAFDARGLAHIPSAANFISVDVGRDADIVYQALLREGVIVRPIANYGLPRHLRITVGREQDNARVVAALDRVLGR
jgi:histidinol-phosphate aminotransferase